MFDLYLIIDLRLSFEVVSWAITSLCFWISLLSCAICVWSIKYYLLKKFENYILEEKEINILY